MFHACVQRFDRMDEKILGGKLNRALADDQNSVCITTLITTSKANDCYFFVLCQTKTQESDRFFYVYIEHTSKERGETCLLVYMFTLFTSPYLYLYVCLRCMDLCVSLKVSPTRSDEQEQQQGIVVSRVAEKGDAVRMDLSMVTARLPKGSFG